MTSSDIYIIKTTPYRESSNLYEAIVKDIGKMTFIHKGIKTNNRRNALELFTPYRVNWSGKGNIKSKMTFKNPNFDFSENDFSETDLKKIMSAKKMVND